MLRKVAGAVSRYRDAHLALRARHEGVRGLAVGLSADFEQRWQRADGSVDVGGWLHREAPLVTCRC